MVYSAKERELEAEAFQLLESPTREVIPTTDRVSGDLIRGLLTSSKPDLVHLGRCVLSIVPEHRKTDLLRDDDGTVADNLARIMVADEEAEAERRFLDAAAARPFVEYRNEQLDQLQSKYSDIPLLRESIDSCMRELVLPPKIAEPSSDQKDMTLIVHGTFPGDWWRPNSGEFWKYVNGLVGNCYNGSDHFRWSGAWSHDARVTASKKLLRWTKARRYRNLVVIAHSHGGNVCFLASQSGLRIDKLFTLGTPMRKEYVPNIQNIPNIINVYSIADKIQSGESSPNLPCGPQKLCDMVGVKNWQATDDGTGVEPSHWELHEAATWRASRIEEFLTARVSP